MDLNKIVSDFEDLYQQKKHNRLGSQLNVILGLPFHDVSILQEEIYKSFRNVSNAISVSLLQVHSQISNGDFQQTVNFEREYSDITSYTRDKPLERTIKYLNNLYEQWATIAQNNNVDLSDLMSEKNKIVTDIKEYLNSFDKAAKFLPKYKTIEDYYIRNRSDLESVDFYKGELDNLLAEYNELTTQKGIRFFLNFKEDTIFKEKLKGMDDIIVEVRDRITQKNPLAIATIADKFVFEQNNSHSDVKQFLNTKEYDSHITNHMKVTKSQKVPEMLAFDDGSLAYKDKNDRYHAVDISNLIEVFDRFMDAGESAIDYMLRKKPKVAKFFKDKYTDDMPSFSNIHIVIQSYLNNEAILKNMNFDLSIFRDKSPEAIDDAIHSSVNNYKVKRYAHSILSNKYKHLLTPESTVLFKQLYEAKFSENQLQELIGKKIAAIHTAEEFELYLNKIVDQFSGFSEFAILSRYHNYNIDPIYTENNVLVFEVKTFEESKELGSPSWCISRTENYFKRYTSNDARQFFIYDFNKLEKDNESMIGITIQKDGQLNTQHAKNDDYLKPNDLIELIRKHIIINEVDKFELTEEHKLQLGLIVKEDLENKVKIKQSLGF